MVSAVTLNKCHINFKVKREVKGVVSNLKKIFVFHTDFFFENRLTKIVFFKPLRGGFVGVQIRI